MIHEDVWGHTPNFPIKTGFYGWWDDWLCERLGGLWEEVKGNEADYNFFKVTVEMP